MQNLNRSLNINVAIFYFLPILLEKNSAEGTLGDLAQRLKRYVKQSERGNYGKQTPDFIVPSGRVTKFCDKGKDSRYFGDFSNL